MVEEDAPEEDDRVSAYVSVFSSQIPEGVLQARQDIKVRSNTPSSGTNSSAGRRQQPRAARAALSTPGTPELPETQGSADRSKASTPLTGVASLNIPTPSDSRLPTPGMCVHTTVCIVPVRMYLCFWPRALNQDFTLRIYGEQ